MKTTAAITVSLTIVLALAGCSSGSGTPTSTATPKAVPSDTPTPTPTAAKLTFTEPTACATIVPTSRLDSFAAQGLVLLGGPDGKYGNDYLADATPEEIAGGISCIWGYADSEVSSITVSVAPLSPSTRGGVIASFTQQGLNEKLTADGTSYGLQGDKNLNPAIYNVLRGNSWISVITTIGGPDSYTDAVAIADEVHGAVYTAG